VLVVRVELDQPHSVEEMAIVPMLGTQSQELESPQQVEVAPHLHQPPIQATVVLVVVVA
jgi:hypothetical protein